MIVTSFGGRPTRFRDDLIHLAGLAAPGKEVDVEVITTDGEKQTLKVTPGGRLAGRNQRELEAELFAKDKPDQEIEKEGYWRGMRLRNPSPAEEKREGEGGVVVVRLLPGGAAGRAGLRPGDWIESVGPNSRSLKSVKDLEDFDEHTAKLNDAVLLRVKSTRERPGGFFAIAPK